MYSIINIFLPEPIGESISEDMAIRLISCGMREHTSRSLVADRNRLSQTIRELNKDIQRTLGHQWYTLSHARLPENVLDKVSKTNRLLEEYWNRLEEELAPVIYGTRPVIAHHSSTPWVAWNAFIPPPFEEKKQERKMPRYGDSAKDPIGPDIYTCYWDTGRNATVSQLVTAPWLERVMVAHCMATCNYLLTCGDSIKSDKEELKRRITKAGGHIKAANRLVDSIHSLPLARLLSWLRTDGGYAGTMGVPRELQKQWNTLRIKALAHIPLKYSFLVHHKQIADATTGSLGLNLKKPRVYDLAEALRDTAILEEEWSAPPPGPTADAFSFVTIGKGSVPVCKRYADVRSDYEYLATIHSSLQRALENGIAVSGSGGLGALGICIDALVVRISEFVYLSWLYMAIGIYAAYKFSTSVPENGTVSAKDALNAPKRALGLLSLIKAAKTASTRKRQAPRGDDPTCRSAEGDAIDWKTIGNGAFAKAVASPNDALLNVTDKYYDIIDKSSGDMHLTVQPLKHRELVELGLIGDQDSEGDVPTHTDQ